MNNELEHHGILGQKWGVRRYQNPDGTRTSAGKKRYKEDSTGQKSGMSVAKKIAIGAGAGLGAAAAVAGAAYLAKKSSMKTKALFESDVAKEFLNIEEGIRKGTATATERDNAFIRRIKDSHTTREAVKAIEKNPLDAARLMTEHDWNRYKPFITEKNGTRDYIFNTMKYFGKFH